MLMLCYTGLRMAARTCLSDVDRLDHSTRRVQPLHRHMPAVQGYPTVHDETGSNPGHMQRRRRVALQRTSFSRVPATVDDRRTRRQRDDRIVSRRRRDELENEHCLQHRLRKHLVQLLRLSRSSRHSGHPQHVSHSRAVSRSSKTTRATPTRVTVWSRAGRTEPDAGDDRHRRHLRCVSDAAILQPSHVGSRGRRHVRPRLLLLLSPEQLARHDQLGS